MTGARADRRTADRFRDLVRHRLVPGLASLGFTERLPGTLVATEAQGVVWLLDLEVAPWSNPQKVCFSVAWGVHVPGLDEALGDPPVSPTIAAADVAGRLGADEHGMDPAWFELRSFPKLIAEVRDAALAGTMLGRIVDEVMPELESLSTPVKVQRHLYDGLVTGRGVPKDDELRTIRRIAALSLVLGDRDNAAKWLDHLEARSSAAMAPDLVAERLAPLRQRLAS
jgi:hypothetical protein